MFTVLSNENVDGRMIMAELDFFVKSCSEIRALISVCLWQVSQAEVVTKRVYFRSIDF